MTNAERDGLSTLGLVLAFVVVLGALGQSMDAHDANRQADRQQSITHGTSHQGTELRRNLSAADLCRDRHGEAGFTWTAAGKLVCIPRRGKQILASNF